MGLVKDKDTALPSTLGTLLFPPISAGQGIGTGPVQDRNTAPDHTPLTGGGFSWDRQRETESTTLSTSLTFFLIVASFEVYIALRER